MRISDCAIFLYNKSRKKPPFMDDLIYIDLALDLGLLCMLRLTLCEESHFKPAEANCDCPATILLLVLSVWK